MTDLVDPLSGASIPTATALEKACSSIAEALGDMHADLILTDSSEESD